MRALRVVVGLLAASALVVAALLVAREFRSDDAAELYGSRPPAGQKIPPIHRIAGIEPALPSGWSRGRAAGPLLLVATCLDCGTGDAYGSALERIPWDAVPDSAHIHAIVWNGNATAWRREWDIDEKVQIHTTTPDGVDKLAEMLQVDRRFGHARLIDSGGTWRASYPSGSALPAGMVDDLRRYSR